MMHKQDLQKSYSDILHEQKDVHLTHLVHELDNIYTAPERPAQLTWERARAMQAPNKQVQRRIATLPQARKWQWSLRGAITVAMLAAVLIAGTAYAAVAFISPILAHIIDRGPDSATHQLLQGDQFTSIGQTKTVDGVTVKLEAAYADVSQVIIGCTVVTTDSNKTAFPAEEAALKTRQGLVLAPRDSGASDYNTLHFSEVAAFDASAITGAPKQLDLHLNMVVGTLSGPRGKSELQVQGSLAFDFSIPFHAGKILTPGQSVTVDGQKVTLQKVVIAPSETRIYISGLKGIKDALPIVDLSVPGINGHIGAYEGSPESNGTWEFTYLHALFDKRGAWTITVTEMSSSLLSAVQIWTFHVDVTA